MPEEKCEVFDRLSQEAHNILKKICELSELQIDAFDRGDGAEFRRLDRELELTVGAKERIIGALRQHAAEHGCRRPFLAEN